MQLLDKGLQKAIEHLRVYQLARWFLIEGVTFSRTARSISGAGEERYVSHSYSLRSSQRQYAGRKSGVVDFPPLDGWYRFRAVPPAPPFSQAIRPLFRVLHAPRFPLCPG